MENFGDLGPNERLSSISINGLVGGPPRDSMNFTSSHRTLVGSAILRHYFVSLKLLGMSNHELIVHTQTYVIRMSPRVVVLFKTADVKI